MAENRVAENRVAENRVAENQAATDAAARPRLGLTRGYRAGFVTVLLCSVTAV